MKKDFKKLLVVAIITGVMLRASPVFALEANKPVDRLTSYISRISFKDNSISLVYKGQSGKIAYNIYTIAIKDGYDEEYTDQRVVLDNKAEEAEWATPIWQILCESNHDDKTDCWRFEYSARTGSIDFQSYYRGILYVKTDYSAGPTNWSVEKFDYSMCLNSPDFNPEYDCVYREEYGDFVPEATGLEAPLTGDSGTSDSNDDLDSSDESGTNPAVVIEDPTSLPVDLAEPTQELVVADDVVKTEESKVETVVKYVYVTQPSAVAAGTKEKEPVKDIAKNVATVIDVPKVGEEVGRDTPWLLLAAVIAGGVGLCIWWLWPVKYRDED